MGYTIRGNRIYVTGTVEGKHYRLSTGKEATPINIAWIKKNHRDVLLQLIAKDKPERIEHFEQFALRSIASNSHAIRDGTQVCYNSMINRHIMPYFKHYRLDEIRPSDVRAWQAGLLKKMSARSVKNVRNLLSKIIEEAVMDEIIPKNPVKLVKPPRHEREDDIIPFTLEEVQLLIANASKWMRPFITTAFFTGMRYGELVALKWEDIDFNSKKIIVRRSISHGVENSTKTGKIRIVDMLTPVHDALKEKFKENGLTSEYIFTTRKGTPYSESAAITTTHWKPLLKRCGIAYRVPYNTRHTFATLMLLNGEDILWVSKMLGHSDVSTTMRYYIKFIEEKGKKRAEFLDDHFIKNRTVFAQSENQNKRHA